MSTALNQPPPPINPRPGVVQTLGIINIVFSVLMSVCMLGSTFWLVALSNQPAQVSVEVGKTASGPTTTVAFNPMLGMNDPAFLRFCSIDIVTGLVVNGLMFATGIGLVALRRWGVRGWSALAWIKILRLALLWGYYIVAVAPQLSATMANAALSMFRQQGLPPGRGPTIAEMTRVYSITNLVLGLGMILFGSIYPALSIWLLSRPWANAALIDKPRTEPELP